MKKRVFGFILCLALIVTQIPTAFAAEAKEFSDMPDKDFWSYQALSAAVENGLLNGSGGKLMPNDDLTRAQMAAVVNRAFGAKTAGDISSFTDVADNAWYRDDIAKAVRMGTLNGYGDGKMNPDSPITREQAFTVLSRALKLGTADASALSAFSDRAKVSDYAAGPIAAMVQAGYVNGSGGRIAPKNSITRAEFAQVFYNILKVYFKEAGTFTKDISGNAIVNVPGVVLKDMKISGDLIIGEGVGDGEVTLDGVAVSGRMVVRGGGENSVIIKNNSTVGSILVGKTGDGGVRIRTEEGCRVDNVVIDDGRDEIILEGEFNQVAVKTDAPVILKDADITGLTVNAENADVRLDGTAKVDAVQVTENSKGADITVGKSSVIDDVVSQAESVSLSGEGTVRSAEVSGSNTAVDTKGTKLTVSEDAEGVSENGNDVKSGSTVETGAGGVDPIHTHSWGTGTVTKEPSCYETGVRTYQCSCGSAKTETIPMIEHDWDEGEVTTPASADKEGVMTFRCRRDGCGATKTAPVSYKPYCIELNSGEDNEQTLWFDTLEDAMAEAQKHPAHNEPGEDPWTEYETIGLAGSAVIKDLTLPAGYSLFVAGDLTLTGTLTLGSSDYEVCPGKGAARIFIPMFDETSVTLNDVVLYDGKDPEKGIITAPETEENKDTDHMDVVTLFGARAVDKADDSANGSVYEKPWISFGGFSGEHNFSINRSFDFAKYFDGVNIDDSTLSVQVNADIDLGQIEVRGSGGFVIIDGKSSISSNGRKMLGYTSDCAIRVSDLGGDNTGSVIYCDLQDLVIIGGNVNIDQNISLGNMYVRARFGSDPNKYTVTVSEGVSAELSDCQFMDAVSVINYGTLKIGSNVNVDYELVNNGTLNVKEDLHVGSSMINNGTFINGALTGAGEQNSGSDAFYHQTSGSFANNSGASITNNGYMRLEHVDLVNRGGFETYNSAGLEIRGGSQDIVSTIYNEGYMKVIDEYYDAGGTGSANQICGGMENVRNKTQDDSSWIDWTAEVFSEDGMTAAENAQSVSHQYNRMDICADMTISGEKTLSSFEQYWVESYYDEAQERNAGVKLTVDGTLTVDNGATLNIDGWYSDEGDSAVPELIIGEGGKLIIAGEIPEEWDEDGNTVNEYRDPGYVALWPVSGFKNSGTVIDNGSFEVYMLEDLYGDGRFGHCGELSGLPGDAFRTADTRTFAGLKYAADPENGYNRITVRDNCVITTAGNITIPDEIFNVYIEPGSGLIVEHGNSLTVNSGSVDNCGDISVFGELIIGRGCQFFNDQNLEVGPVTGNEKGRITLNGDLYNFNNLTVYDKGEIVLGSGRCAQGVEFGSEIHLSSAEEGIRYEFRDCTFKNDIYLDYSDGHDGLEIDFDDSCGFAEGVNIIVSADDNTDLSEINENINIFGANGADIISAVPVHVSSGNVEDAICVVNGVSAQSSGWFTVSLRFDEQDGAEDSRVFQIDAGDEDIVKLTGELDDETDELRIQQGRIDISELETDESLYIRIGDEFGPVSVNIGSKTVDIRDEGNDDDFFGFEIIAGKGAVINVSEAVMDNIDGEYCGTDIVVNNGEAEYRTDPHIFGFTGGNDPAVFIGIDDGSVEYTLTKDDEALSFIKEIFSEDSKTHLLRDGENGWFTAAENNEPDIGLTIGLPGDITVIYDRIPVKPEWKDAD